MTTLHQTITALASDFAANVIKVLHDATVTAMEGGDWGSSATTVKTKSVKLAKSGRGSGKRIRRGAAEIAAVVAKVVAVVRKSGAKGVRAEDIREALGVPHKDLMKPVEDALRQKLISKRGNRRATTYFAGKAKAPKPAKKSVKKSTKKSKSVKKAPAKAKAKTKVKTKGTKKSKMNHVAAPASLVPTAVLA